MSRNKDIKLLHDLTRLPYKECRRYMKANHWNFASAYFAASGLDKVATELGPELAEIVGNTMKALSDLVANVCQAVGESLIQIGKNMKGEV